MRVLALETSTHAGSLALVDDTAVWYHQPLDAGRRMAQTFSVAIADALRAADWEPATIGLMALTNGPGAFTGLRIAVTVAKFFGYATGAQVIALNTLDVIVEQLPPGVHSACAVMDAQRQQLFAGVYQRAPDGTWQTVSPCQIVDRAQLESLAAPQMVLTGPALARLPASTAPALARAPADCWTPQAVTVAHLGLRASRAGRATDIWQLLPQYYRPSYAEE